MQNKWLMAKIVQTFKDDNGDVRSVCLKVGQSKSKFALSLNDQ